MPINLSIKNVPNHIAEALKARAEENHRSLQGELMYLLEQAVVEGDTMRSNLRIEQPRAAYLATPAVELPNALGSGHRVSLRDLWEEAQLQALQAHPSGVEIVRQSRYERDLQQSKLIDAPDSYARARALLGLSADTGQAASTPATKAPAKTTSRKRD